MSFIQKHFLIFIDSFGQLCYPQNEPYTHGLQFTSYETRELAESKLRALILANYDGTWEQFVQQYSATTDWMSYSEHAVLYNGAFDIPLQAIGSNSDQVILAGVVSIDVSREAGKQLAVLEWKVHPHHQDHPCLLASRASNDASTIQKHFEAKVAELSGIPYHEWKLFEAYCFEGEHFETWAQRGEPFEVDEVYWFDETTCSFMMEGIDEKLIDEDFKGAQGCCIVEL